MLPAHLRALAHCEREISVDAVPTQRGVLDAVEAQYPMLRGTLRDPRTGVRRPFVRFFACEEDLSHDEPDAALPAAGRRGQGAVPRHRRDGRRLTSAARRTCYTRTAPAAGTDASGSRTVKQVCPGTLSTQI